MYDFNLRFELCRLCGSTALRSGHRFCVWFCEPCRGAVKGANDRLGGYVIPIGRHSIHAGHAIRPAASRRARGRQIDAVLDFVHSLPERMRALVEWRATQVQLLWAAAGLPDDEIALPRFEEAAAAVVRSSEELIPPLLEHLAVA